MGSGLRQSLRRGVKRAAITGGLEASGLLARAGVMRAARGRGVIFTLHHVRPKIARAFDPNGHLEVTPDFLDAAIRQLQAQNYRFLPLDKVPAALADPTHPPFAVFTLDDGYRNNRDHALPVFARYQVPFTVFVAGGYIDRSHSMWWETAAALIDKSDAALGEKYAAFARIGETILRPGEAGHVAELDRQAAVAGIDARAIADDLTMNAEELKSFAAHPLVTLGAHTISHRSLGLLDDIEAEREMIASAERVETITGQRPFTIAYPYGDAQAATPRDFALAARLGFSVGVTTRPGTLTAGQLPTALPRVSLNGFYQKRRYVRALASGIPFRLMG